MLVWREKTMKRSDPSGSQIIHMILRGPLYSVLLTHLFFHQISKYKIISLFSKRFAFDFIEFEILSDEILQIYCKYIIYMDNFLSLSPKHTKENS